MAGLWIPRAAQKPPAGVGIRWSHPLAPDIACATFGDGVDGARTFLNLSTGRLGAIPGSYAPWGVGPDGPHLQSVTGGGAVLTDAVGRVGAGDISIYARARYASSATNRGLCLLGGPAGTPRFHAIVATSASGLQWVLTGVAAYNSNLTLTPGQWYGIGIAYRRGVSTLFHVAPLFDSSAAIRTTTVTTTGTPNTNAEGSAIASTASTGLSNAWGEAYSYFCAWNRALTADDFAAMDAQPYAFLMR